MVALTESGPQSDEKLSVAKMLRWQMAVDLLDSWTAKGVKADETSYAHALRACVNARVPGAATRVVRRMKDAGLQPNVQIYSM